MIEHTLICNECGQFYGGTVPASADEVHKIEFRARNDGWDVFTDKKNYHLCPDCKQKRMLKNEIRNE